MLIKIATHRFAASGYGSGGHENPQDSDRPDVEVRHKPFLNNALHQSALIASFFVIGTVIGLIRTWISTPSKASNKFDDPSKANSFAWAWWCGVRT